MRAEMESVPTVLREDKVGGGMWERMPSPSTPLTPPPEWEAFIRCQYGVDIFGYWTSLGKCCGNIICQGIDNFAICV